MQVITYSQPMARKGDGVASSKLKPTLPPGQSRCFSFSFSLLTKCSFTRVSNNISMTVLIFSHSFTEPHSWSLLVQGVISRRESKH